MQAHVKDIDLSNKHILVCEDHPLNQEIVKELLEQKKAIVNIAEDGQKGVECFTESSVGYYDLILMDVRMPVIDGYRAAKMIRNLPRKDAASVPIIALTADAFTDDIQKSIDAGMNGHIAKPIDPPLLYDKINNAINARH